MSKKNKHIFTFELSSNCSKNYILDCQNQGVFLAKPRKNKAFSYKRRGTKQGRKCSHLENLIKMLHF